MAQSKVDDVEVKEPEVEVMEQPAKDESKQEQPAISSIGPVTKRTGPPILDISNITASTATVTFHSELSKDAVLYSVTYRREPEGDNEEKESEWKEQVLDKGTNQYIVRGLNPESKYQINGRYQVLANMLWSASSDNISIVTLKKKTIQFEWDPARKGESVKLSNNNKKMRNRGFWRSVYSKQKLSADSMTEVSWEVTINDIDSAVQLMIGFVDSCKIECIDVNNYLGTTGSALYIQSVGDDRFSVYNGTNEVFDKEKWKASKCRNGDRILMTFDFVTSKCSVSYNGEHVGVISQEVPNELYLAVSPYSKCSLETTKFDII